MGQNKLFKKYRVLPLIMILSFLSACNMVNYIIHPETDHLRSNGVSVKDFEHAKRLVLSEILMVPDFTALSESYDPPAAGVELYSIDSRSIYIERVELSGVGFEFKKLIQRDVKLTKKLNEVHYQIVPLFSSTDLSQKDIASIWKGNGLVLTIFYSATAGDRLEQKAFNLVLKSRKDVSWPT